MSLAPRGITKPIDQSVLVDRKTFESLVVSAHWEELESAAANGQQSCFSQMSALGAALGDALFAANAQSSSTLLDNLALAQKESRALRLLFKGEASKLPVEFIQLPDELIHECEQQSIVLSDPVLALNDRIELIRAPADLQVDGRRVEVSRDDPLRILIAVSNPSAANWPNIPRAEPQARIIEAACRGIGGEFVKVSVLSNCTPDLLARGLAEHAPHILHFVGHGTKGIAGELQPSLVLHSDSGQGVDLLTGFELLAMCSTYPELVTLNACHLGGTGPLDDGFAGTLSEAGVSLVLAMQLPVIDIVAEHIAESVYRPFLRGLPLATVLANVRRQFAIDSRRRNYPEWATPTLYARVADTSRFAGIPAVGISEARSRASVSRFVGREWLWGEVQKHLQSSNKNIGLLVAEAGMGKSSFLDFCQRRLESALPDDTSENVSAPPIISYRYHYGERADATGCARSLSAQLRRWLIQINKPIPDERPPDAYSSPYVRECAVLSDLLGAATTHSKVTLLLDALDEASDAGDALPIAELLSDWPENFCVFATARPEWYAKWRARYPGSVATDDPVLDPRFAPTTLEPMSAPNLQDVALFLYRAFGPYGITFTQNECVELARNIGGSFLVADILCGMLRSGDDKSLIRERFQQADSVTGAYDLVFRTLAADLSADSQAERKLSDTEDLLALITFSHDPLTDEQLQDLFDIRGGGSKGDVADGLNHLRRFLDSDLNEHGEQTYRPYHQSLRSYGERRLDLESASEYSDGTETSALTTERPLPRPWQAYAKIWTDYCLRWKELERYPRTYALRHVVPHLIALGNDESVLAIEDVLTDYSYIAAALGADPSKPERPLDVNELIAHYEAAGAQPSVG